MTGARLTAVDGLGGKRPAAFLVEVGERRLLLDLGEGPTPGVRPDLGRLDRVDAILLSHAHGDHVGALDLAGRLGDPEVHATAATWAAIANAPIPAPRRRALPARSRTTIAGVAVDRWVDFAAALAHVRTARGLSPDDPGAPRRELVELAAGVEADLASLGGHLIPALRVGPIASPPGPLPTPSGASTASPSRIARG